MQRKDPDLRRRIRGDAGRSYELAAVLVCPVPTRSPPACSHGIVSLKACSPLPNGVPPLLVRRGVALPPHRATTPGRPRSRLAVASASNDPRETSEQEPLSVDAKRTNTNEQGRRLPYHAGIAKLGVSWISEPWYVRSKPIKEKVGKKK